MLATTRRRDARLSGGGRALIDVDTFAPAESDAYLRARLTDVNMVHLLDAQAANLPRELGHLPLALGFRGAWSMPIKAPQGHVLGTFGTYFREHRSPTAAEREVVALLAEVAA